VDLKQKLAWAGAASPSQGGGTKLDALREKMAAILGRPVPVPRAPADPAQTSLPFAREDTLHGPICRRCERLPPSHHVGRIPVDAAQSARGAMLALLALDPELAGCDMRTALFLDTETTGFASGAGVIAFLVGISYFDADGQLLIEQFLLKSPAEERAMLQLLRERFERATLLVTYNGKAFDMPLLAGRMLMNRLPPLPRRPHLDLVHVARRLHRHRLGGCRLVHLESDVLGFVRGEDIDGGDVPARYSHFLRTGDEEALRAVVEHNALDVVSMAALLGLYGEPAETLHDEDLVGLARTFQRARALDLAERTAQLAVQKGGGTRALRLRGQIAKARGDKAAALVDFEALCSELGDAETRLELAKLYEHHVKDVVKALELVTLGTGERPEAHARRRARLERKVARARSHADQD
jgi:hypothetical protein